MDFHIVKMYKDKWSKTKMSKIFFFINVWRKNVFDIYFTEFGAVMTTVLPVLFKYCYKYCYSDSRKLSPRFLCRPTTLYIIARAIGRQERNIYGKQLICLTSSGSAHFHVSWLSDFINYQKPYINRFTNHFSIHS